MYILLKLQHPYPKEIGYQSICLFDTNPYKNFQVIKLKFLRNITINQGMIGLK